MTMGILKKIGIGIGVVFAIIIILGLIGSTLNPTGKATETQPKETITTTTAQCVPNWQCSNWSECTLDGKHQRTCSDVNNCDKTIEKTIEEEKCTISFDTIKSNALNVSYDNLMRYTENYKEKIVYYRGEVEQVVGSSGDDYVLRVAVTPGEYRIWTDIIWVNYHGSRVLEKDIVELFGKVKGMKTYESILGSSITIPEIDVIYLNVVFKAELNADCGKTGTICCENNYCDYGNVCTNNVCQECGGENQLPCANGCDYDYELINNQCVRKCSSSQIRIGGTCTDAKIFYENQYLQSAKICSNDCIRTDGSFEVTLVRWGYFTHLKYDTWGDEVTEYRVDIKVKNIGSEQESFSIYDSAMIVGTSQYSYSYESNFDGSNIYPGIIKEGYLVFENVPANLAGSAQLIVGKYYAGYPIGYITYSFTVDV
jgi:hypothetical protein